MLFVDIFPTNISNSGVKRINVKSYLRQANGKILGNISPNSGNYECSKIMIFLPL